MVISPSVVVRTTPWAAGPLGTCGVEEEDSAGDSDLEPKSFLKKDILMNVKGRLRFRWMIPISNDRDEGQKRSWNQRRWKKRDGVKERGQSREVSETSFVDFIST